MALVLVAASTDSKQDWVPALVAPALVAASRWQRALAAGRIWDLQVWHWHWWQRTVALLSGHSVPALQGRGLRPGNAEGPLVVTNLTVATHLIGSPWLPDLRGAVLVLEDVGEAPYRVDRMLTQWRTAGLLQRLAGVGCGRFSWDKDDILPGDFTMEEILEERLGDLGIPVVLDLPVGHGGPNQALRLGAQVQLDGQAGTLDELN